MDDGFRCGMCGSTYKRNRSFRHHVRKKHPDADVNEVAPSLNSLKNKSNKSIELKECCDCKKKFTTLRSLHRHQIKLHNIVIAPAKEKKNCPLCKRNFSKLDLLNVHFQNEHGIPIESEELKFSKHEYFVKWKSSMEKSTQSFFKKTVSYAVSGGDKHTYICHRSGIYKPTGTGLRRLKTQGSRKIGGTCPARITVIVGSDKENCSVKFTKTHVGHANELDHIDLAKADRDFIAAKIASGIPFDNILDEVRYSVNCDHERPRFLKKKDLHNIKSAYGLKSYAVKCKNLAVKRKNNAVKRKTDAVRRKTDAVRRKNDAVRHQNDAVRHQNDAVRHQNDAVRHQNDAVRHQNDAVRHQNDAVSIDSWINDMNEAIRRQQTQTSDANTLEESKNNLIKEVSDIIRSIESQEELEAVKKILARVGPSLTAIRVRNAKKSRKRVKGALIETTQEQTETVAATLLLTNWVR